MSSIRLALFCLLVVGAVLLGVQWLNRPVQVGPDIPGGQLQSLSFAPYREGFSPLNKKFPLPEHISEDLKTVAQYTRNIRTYTSLEGLQHIHSQARELGLTLLQGAWLTHNESAEGRAANLREIQALITAANKYPDVVKRVIVGNEVLLRGEMPVDELIQYIRQVRKAIKQPVSYADVWSRYEMHPELFKEVDFITIHILPYWEDEPIAVSKAPAHIEEILSRVEQQAKAIAPGKRILIGETGWPSQGRQRGQAVPSVINEAAYVRQVVSIADSHGWDYNIVEAFNQPWKSNLEGVVGANWGLLDEARNPVFPLQGPVISHTRSGWQLSLSILMCFGLIAANWRLLINVSTAQQMFQVNLYMALSLAFVWGGWSLWSTSYSDGQRIYSLVVLLLNATIAWVLPRYLLQIRDHSNGKAPVIGPISLKWLYLLVIAFAIFKCWGFATFGRYLSFPLPEALVSALGAFACLLWPLLAKSSPPPVVLPLSKVTGRWLALVLLLAGLAVPLGETMAFLRGGDFIAVYPNLSQGLPVALGYTFGNQQLVAWVMCVFLLAAFCWQQRSRN